MSIKNKYHRREGNELNHSIEELKKANMKSDMRSDIVLTFERELEEKYIKMENEYDKKFYAKVINYIKENPAIKESSDFLGYFRMVEGVYLSSSKGVRKIISESLFKDEVKLELKIGNLIFSKKIL